MLLCQGIGDTYGWVRCLLDDAIFERCNSEQAAKVGPAGDRYRMQIIREWNGPTLCTAVILRVVASDADLPIFPRDFAGGSTPTSPPPMLLNRPDQLCPCGYYRSMSRPFAEAFPQALRRVAVVLPAFHCGIDCAKPRIPTAFVPMVSRPRQV